MTSRPRLVLLALVVLQATWLLAHWEQVCMGPDAVGLCGQAQRIAVAGAATFQPESPAQLVGNHWVQIDSVTYAGRYPPGYPLFLAAAYRAVGPSWSLLLDPLLAVTAVLLLFGAARRLSGPTGALVGAALLASFPLLNRLALHGDTHVPALVCVLTGIWLLLRWDIEPTLSRALAVGLAWGFLPALRYGEVTMAATAGAWLAWRALRGLDRGTRHLLAAAVGAAVPLGALLAYHAAVYGSPLATGYASTNEQTAFAVANIGPNLAFYTAALVRQPSAIALLGLGVWALAAMLRSAEHRRFGALLGLLVLSTVATYVPYYWGGREAPGLALRFFLPVVPCLTVAVAWLVGRTRVPARALAVVLVVTGALGAYGSWQSVREEAFALERARAVLSAVDQAVPDGAVVVIPRTLGETLEYAGRWHVVPGWLFPGDPDRKKLLLPWEVPAEMARQYAGVAAPTQIAKGAGYRRHYRGLDDESVAGVVMRDIEAWRPGAPVFWIGDPRAVTAAAALLPDRRLDALGRVVFPPAPSAAFEVDAPYWVPRGDVWLYRLDPSK